jgi:hypothetical protein
MIHRASILSSSEDGHIKCHNFDGDLYMDIDINSFNEIIWSMPYDWMEVKVI